MLQIPLKIIADVGFAQFQNSNLCPPPNGAWKILRTTLCCFVFLQSRGEGLKSKENYGTKFSLLFKPSPRDWRKKATKCGSLNFPRNVTYILCVGECQNHILMHSCLPIPGRPFQNVKKLHGLRISEGNISVHF